MARKKIPENYEKTRQGIIDAAIELMVKGSITDFSLTDVAGKMGLTKAALYWYFPNKNALIDQAAQSIYDTYIGYIEKISSSSLSAYEKLRKIVLGEEDTIHSALMCVFPIKFYLESYAENNAVKTLIRNGYEKYNALITALLEEGIQSGEFQTLLPTRELSKFITGAIDGLAFQNLLVSSEKTEVSRTIIFSVLDQILGPVTAPIDLTVKNTDIHPSTRKEE